MIPANLTRGQIYVYAGTRIKYWYEQLNYWSFTTCDENQTIVLLHSEQVKSLTYVTDND